MLVTLTPGVNLGNAFIVGEKEVERQSICEDKSFA